MLFTVNLITWNTCESTQPWPNDRIYVEIEWKLSEKAFQSAVGADGEEVTPCFPICVCGFTYPSTLKCMKYRSAPLNLWFSFKSPTYLPVLVMCLCLCWQQFTSLPALVLVVAATIFIRIIIIFTLLTDYTSSLATSITTGEKLYWVHQPTIQSLKRSRIRSGIEWIVLRRWLLVSNFVSLCQSLSSFVLVIHFIVKKWSSTQVFLVYDRGLKIKLRLPVFSPCYCCPFATICNLPLFPWRRFFCTSSLSQILTYI